VSWFEGEYVILCSFDWGGKTYSASLGETIHLPPDANGYCYGCGKCSVEYGIQCWSLYTPDGRPYGTILYKLIKTTNYLNVNYAAAIQFIL